MNRSDQIGELIGRCLFVRATIAACDSNTVPFLWTKATQHRQVPEVVIPIDLSHPAPAAAILRCLVHHLRLLTPVAAICSPTVERRPYFCCVVMKHAGAPKKVASV